MQFGTREIVLFLTVLLLPVVSYFTIFQPQNRRIDEAKDEIVHKQQMLAQLRQETARSESLEEINASLQGRIDEIEARLPSNKEVDQIVRQVSQLAVESGLDSPSLQNEKTLTAARYLEQPLKITTEGTFDGFYDFLLSLERLPRITRVVDMKVTESRDEEKDIKAEFTLSIYFREEGSAS